jgi:hypothetical protein
MGSRVHVAAWLVLALVAAHVPALPKGNEPQQVRVQHILIGFKRSVPNKKIERTKDEARALAEDLAGRARAATPEEFTKLVEQYTDDSAPGIYVLVNTGAPLVAGSRQRNEMVTRFGDIAFTLAVGEVGLAAYHAGSSPYGWHVIKRLE